MGLLQDWFGPPKPIDPDKIYNMSTSKYTAQMADRSADMLDPQSALMQSYSKAMGQRTDDDIYTNSRLQRQQNAQMGGGQSGIMNQNITNSTTKLQGEGANAFQNMYLNNLNQSNQLLTGAAGQDQTARLNSADAYGQNVTNKNNYNSAMGGMVMQGAGALMMCDFRMKKDVKRVGHLTTKNGKVGMYKFKYKGHNKEHHGVIAQEVQGVVPKAVHKGKNGLLYVDYKRLQG